MGKKLLSVVLVGIVLVAVGQVGAAEKGSILSYFDPDESSVFGLDVREQSIGTELHAITAGGFVVQMGIENVSAIKGGRMGQYNAKNEMMSPDADPQSLRGMAVIRTYQGPYGWKYAAATSARGKFISVWGDPNVPGEMSWTLAFGNFGLLIDSDFCATAREKIDDAWPGIWTTWSGSKAGYPTNAIFRYPSSDSATYGAIVEWFTFDKALKSVALGDDETELWILAADNEVLNVSTADGSILDRFYLDDQFTGGDVWGFTYDPSEKVLWLCDRSDPEMLIYQVSTGQEAYLDADLNKDYYVNMADFAQFTSEWLHCTDPCEVACDQYH